ncbi:hypothetical protein RJ641_023012, partial [Dillenia turbinata]
ISKISMPNLLATSIFSAQNGQTVVFYRNCQLLLLLCFISGYVKRLRENLYTALMYQVVLKQEDVERAEKLAHAHEFISSLPNGYRTFDDYLLSGGQKQLTAIDIAILRDTPILILDEVTSALDAESEHYIKVKLLRKNLYAPQMYQISKISMPNLLATSIFSAQNGQTVVKRLRENLYTALITFDDYLLSGGQKQLTAIDIAILRDTPILILDEVTSALDAESEHYIKVKLLRKNLYAPQMYQISKISMPNLLATSIFSAQNGQTVTSGMSNGHDMVVVLKQEDVERAEKLAHAHEFISSLPNGYRTFDDYLLSGGQKQLTAIDIAILRDTPILILDEVTSALDAESEHYIKVKLLRKNLYAPQMLVLVSVEKAHFSTFYCAHMSPQMVKFLLMVSHLRVLDIWGPRHNIEYVGQPRGRHYSRFRIVSRPFGTMQEPRHFHMDIISNISFGCTTDPTQEDVERAEKFAHVCEFISSLPNVGGTKAADCNCNSNPSDTPILILEKATSALDAENEQYIMAISTTKVCDKIVVMDGDQIVE